jgi:hypothetical protein
MWPRSHSASAAKSRTSCVTFIEQNFGVARRAEMRGLGAFCEQGLVVILLGGVGG